MYFKSNSTAPPVSALCVSCYLNPLACRTFDGMLVSPVAIVVQQMAENLCRNELELWPCKWYRVLCSVATIFHSFFPSGIYSSIKSRRHSVSLYLHPDPVLTRGTFKVDAFLRVFLSLVTNGCCGPVEQRSGERFVFFCIWLTTLGHLPRLCDLILSLFGSITVDCRDDNLLKLTSEHVAVLMTSLSKVVRRSSRYAKEVNNVPKLHWTALFSSVPFFAKTTHITFTLWHKKVLWHLPSSEELHALRSSSVGPRMEKSLQRKQQTVGSSDVVSRYVGEIQCQSRQNLAYGDQSLAIGRGRWSWTCVHSRERRHERAPGVKRSTTDKYG